MRALVLSVLALSAIWGCSNSDSTQPGPAGAAGQTAGGGAGTAGTSGAAGATAGGGSGGDTQNQAGAGAGGVGGDAGAAGTAGGGTGGTTGEDPATLFETGLYADAAMTQLAAGVLEYTPQFALWSDGAEKRRFIQIPEGMQIDTTDMDYWMFPVGTKVWKEFTRDTTRVETRLLWKRAEGDWFMGAYEWTPDLTAANLVPRAGAQDVVGTTHDIPAARQCDECHKGQTDKVLGFSAIQLSHDGSAVNLAYLKTNNLLSAPPTVNAFEVPGNPVERAAIGLLHANCGQCHSQYGNGFDRNDMELWLKVDTLGDLQQTAPYQTAVGVLTDGDLSEHLPGITYRIVPGDADQSAIFLRMGQRDAQRLVSMPPIGTELTDMPGMTAVETWINSLPPVADAGADGG
jgi:hypothetical protein